MVHYSVLMPQRDAAAEIGQRVPQLCQAFEDLLLPYEMICIDDGSRPESVEQLRELMRRYACLRVLQFDRPRGTAAALTAGMAAARGRIILALDPRDREAPHWVPLLISKLSRYDLVTASRTQSFPLNFWRGLQRRTRVLLRTPTLHGGDELLWAAGRNAVRGLTLPPGTFRLMAAFAARRSLRVSHLALSDQEPPHGSDFRLGLFDRLLSGWFSRRFEPHLAVELMRDGNGGDTPIDFSPPRVDLPLPAPVPPPLFQPQEKPQRDSH